MGPIQQSLSGDPVPDPEVIAQMLVSGVENFPSAKTSNFGMYA